MIIGWGQARMLSNFISVSGTILKEFNRETQLFFRGSRKILFLNFCCQIWFYLKTDWKFIFCDFWQITTPNHFFFHKNLSKTMFFRKINKILRWKMCILTFLVVFVSKDMNLCTFERKRNSVSYSTKMTKMLEKEHVQVQILNV